MAAARKVRQATQHEEVPPEEADAEFGVSPFEQGSREDGSFEGMRVVRLADDVGAFGLGRVLRAIAG